MRTRKCVHTGVAISFLSDVATALAAAPLPGVVATALQEAAAICSDVGGTPDTSQAVRRSDLNGDGNEDFVLDVGGIACNGAASVYGDRAKDVSVFAGDGKGGARSAFSAAAYAVRLDGTGASARLWLTVSGASCGKPPARDFASEAFCERYIVWNSHARKFDFAPVTTVKMIQ